LDNQKEQNLYRPEIAGEVPATKSKGTVVWLLGLVLSLLLGAWLGSNYLTGRRVVAAKQGGVSVSRPTPAVSILSGGGVNIGENTIADIAENAAESVVNIDIRTSVLLPKSHPQMNDFGLFFGPNGSKPVPHQFEKRGAGSGLIIRPEGYILTNNHVVMDAGEIKVTLNDGSVYKGKVVGRDKFTDLALVKIPAKGLPGAELGSSESLRPGDWAIAIGSPLGLDHTVTMGIISAIGRSLGDLNNNVELIQTDAAINPGNSGGPLLNIKGEVIGINTAIRSDAQNIGFAIPVDVAAHVVKSLLEDGHIDRPYLGVYMQDMTPALARAIGLPADTGGIVVAQVDPQGAAAKSGLRQGDVIQKIDGKPMISAKTVQKQVRKHTPGETLNVLVNRDGKLKAVEIKIGKYPDR
jgi:S1-C subfamily serine protease